MLDPLPVPIDKEVPKFEDWFTGRLWTECVVANQNKPSEVEAKKSIYATHLEPAFGKKKLEEIGIGEVAQFKARLVGRKIGRGDNARTLSRQRCNNVLTVLSKSLRYAAEVGMIDAAPRVGLFKVERPEVRYSEFEEYARILAAARDESWEWYAAVCLADEGRLRIGEVRALKWREHVDLVAGTLTVTEETRHGITGTPKGGKRRVVPMTSTLLAALKALPVVRTGYMVRNADGAPMADGQTTHAVRRICRKAWLPERGWHGLRHSFGTHAALLGVNPWRLQGWMGHGRIDETMIYVHVASIHQRPLPAELRKSAGADDPDRRILVLLGQRAAVKRDEPERRCITVASPAFGTEGENEKAPSP